MTDEEIDAMLVGLRHRRMTSRALYENSVRLKEEAEKKKLDVLLETKLARFEKELDKYEKYADKMEKLANDIRAIRLQLGADPML